MKVQDYIDSLDERQHNHLNRVLLGVTFIIAVPVSMFAIPYIAAAILLFAGN